MRQLLHLLFLQHPELAALRDLSYVADRLKSVVLHVREQSHTTPSTSKKCDSDKLPYC